MGRLAATFGRAVAAHRQARGHLDAARRALAGVTDPAPPAETADMVHRLRRVGETLSAVTAGPEFPGRPVPIRLGEGTTVDGGFPVVVPLVGGAHLAIDADARDPRTAALLRSLIIRLLMVAPAGSVRVVALDNAALGATFLPLRPLVDAGVLSPPATSDEEIQALLAGAERHARAGHSADNRWPSSCCWWSRRPCRTGGPS